MAKFLDNVGLTKLVELIKGSLPGKATSSTLGLVKPDNSTITVDSDGILSSNAPYTFTNGLTENNGTVSWDLNDRVLAGAGTKSVMLGNATDFNLSNIGNYAVGTNQGRPIGMFSFASNSSTADGQYSHAEGSGSAEGQYSHAEGWRTVAQSAYQHAEGYCNEIDSNMIFQNIVGNGTAANNRINIFTRDWDGNEYLRGNLYVGCNSYGTNANGLTTTNAGGSKVATESYVDTAIANLPSGSSFSGSYNDLTDKPTLFSGDYNDLSNKPTIPNAYTLPVASTSTLGGVKVDGSTITIDNNGVISGSGGGSSYTAGDGIEIDSNGVISRTDIGLTGMSLFSSGYTSGFSFGNTPSASTVSQLAENLKKYGISNYSGDSSFTPTALNEAMGGTQYATYFLSSDVTPGWNWNYKAYNSTLKVGSWGYRDTPCFVIGANKQIYGTTSFSKLRTVMGWNLGELIQLNASSWTNLTTSNTVRRLPQLMRDINDVIGDINTRIPTAPTTDGTYMLKCVVSSGTPTYSWESVNVGGSY